MKKTNALEIRRELKDHCCADGCISELDLEFVKEQRECFWSQCYQQRKNYVKNQLETMKIYDQSHAILNNYKVCKAGFRVALGLPKNLYYKCLENSTFIQNLPSKPREMQSESFQTLKWMADFFSFHGDRMPHRGRHEVWLPYKTKWQDLFKIYLEEEEITKKVSRAQFFKLRKDYFNHVKKKKVCTFILLQ